jgi:hypothetical protein
VPRSLTDGWSPPAAIEPGDTRGMQSDSSGSIPIIGNIMTETEGWATFDVVGPDHRHGMIYVYWDNPYYGVTKAKFPSSSE